jgi:hypothetical protein
MCTRAAVQKLVVFLVALAARPLWAGEPIDLSPQAEPAGPTRVSSVLEVGGEVLVPIQSGDEQSASTVERFPISVAATLRYDERRLPAAAGGAARALRYYDQADAVIKIANGGQSSSLPEDRRLILVEATDGRASLSTVDGLMDRDELDLVDVVGDTLLVDRLLPATPVADGDTWNQDAQAMADLLCLDSVAVCEVQSILEKHNSGFAKVRLAGVVHGMSDGAATEQEVRGVYLFDRQARQITRFNLAVREKRSVGAASRGLDVVSKLRLEIDPIDASSHLGDEVVAAASQEQRPAAGPLVYDSPEQGFRIQYDRQWFITDHERESVTMRRVADGNLVAQCTISRLPPRSAGRQTSLEQFEKDVRYSLGDRFDQLVSSSQWVNAHGHYCYEVVARGSVQELPVEWHYFLVAPESGHRVTAAVTIEGSMVEKLGRADRDLLNRLELISPETQQPGTAARPADDATR